MNYAKRFQKLAEELDMSPFQLAELFGVDHQTFYSWWNGKTNPRTDFLATLVRFEREDYPALSPQLSPEFLTAFSERARQRASARMDRHHQRRLAFAAGVGL